MAERSLFNSTIRILQATLHCILQGQAERKYIDLCIFLDHTVQLHATLSHIWYLMNVNVLNVKP
jgi:hypothetical protein